MKKFLKFTLIFLFFIYNNSLFAKSNYFNDGVSFFKIKRFEEAEFKFEQDLVFNPKCEMSYLYLSKIFKNFDKRDLEEQNLKTVILLDPKNSQAYYLLSLKKIRDGDFKLAEKNADSFKKFCSIKCEKYHYFTYVRSTLLQV